MKELRPKLFKKSGAISIQLSRDLIFLEKGEKLKTIDYYSNKFQVGRGTVQEAFRFLEKNNVIALEAKGHLGTFLREKNFSKLWEITDWGHIVGVMPLPYSKKYEGLASGILIEFKKTGLPLSLAYMRGSKNRLEALKRNRYDFAVTSKLCVIPEYNFGGDLHTYFEFPPKTNVSTHVIVFSDYSKTEIEDGMKIPVDPSSIDHITLTKKECKDKNVKLIETSYGQILENIEKKVFDAAVWNLDEIKEKRFDLNLTKPLQNAEAKEVLEKYCSRVVIVGKKENAFLNDLFKKKIDPEEILKIQDQISKNKRVPEY